MKSIFRLLNWFRSENGSSNASLFLFAGIASELALLIDILCIIIATGGLEYGSRVPGADGAVRGAPLPRGTDDVLYRIRRCCCCAGSSYGGVQGECA